MITLEELEQQRVYLEKDRLSIEAKISRMDAEVKQLIANLHGFEGAIQFCDGLIAKVRQKRAAMEERQKHRQAGKKFAVVPQQIGSPGEIVYKPEIKEKLKQLKPKPLEQLKEELANDNNQSAPA